MAPKTKTTKEINALREAVIKFLLTEEYSKTEEGQLPWIKSKRGSKFIDWSLHWKPFHNDGQAKPGSQTPDSQKLNSKIVKPLSKWGRNNTGGRLKRNSIKPSKSSQDQSALDQSLVAESTQHQQPPKEPPMQSHPSQINSGRYPEIQVLDSSPQKQETIHPVAQTSALDGTDQSKQGGRLAGWGSTPARLSQVVSTKEKDASNTRSSDVPPTGTNNADTTSQSEQADGSSRPTDPEVDQTVITRVEIQGQEQVSLDPNQSVSVVSGSEGSQDMSLEGDSAPGWLSVMAHDEPHGLNNLSPSGQVGAKCFRNVTLQCLSHLPAFIRYLEDAHDAKDCTCVPCILKDFIFGYWQRRDALENVADLLNRSIQKWCPETNDFYGYANNVNLSGDPREYLDMVVIQSLQQCATQANRLTEFENVFCFDYTRAYQCPQCSNIKPDSQQISQATITVDVKVDVVSATLEDCLRDQFSGQTEPRRCTSQQCASQHTTVEAPLRDEKVTKAFFAMPSVMFISINRNSYQFGKNITVNRTVEFGQQVDMTEFLPGGVETLYNLTGVVANSGRDNRSHYIALVRNRNGRGWSLIDDQTVCAYRGRLDRPALPDFPQWRFNTVLLMYEKKVEASR